MKFLTHKEMEESLRISRATLHRYRKAGKIPTMKVGGKVLFNPEDVALALQRFTKRRAA
jgi:excisionase family DNA binding protein